VFFIRAQAGNLPARSDFNIVDGRMDYYFREQDTMFGRFSYHRAPILGQRGLLPPVGAYNQERNDTSAILSYSHTFSAALLNEIRAGFSRDISDVASTLMGDKIVSQVGIMGVTNTGIPGQPALSITGLTGTSSYSIHDKALDNFQVTDNVSWTRGRHAFKFGADFIRDLNNQNYLPNTLYGSFSFTGRYSGVAYADFLLGLPQLSHERALRRSSSPPLPRFGYLHGCITLSTPNPPTPSLYCSNPQDAHRGTKENCTTGWLRTDSQSVLPTCGESATRLRSSAARPPAMRENTPVTNLGLGRR
jgi:hypothetical protein